MLTNTNATLAIRDLLRGAVPERHSELDTLWERYAPAIELASDSRGITMDANKHRIRFDAKTLRIVWLMGFNGWQTIGLYAPALIWSGVFGKTIDEMFNGDEELGQLESEYKARATIAADLINTMRVEDVAWPPDIPEPGVDRPSLKSDQEKVAFDLVCMATAFVFLHEFRHVMFLNDGDMPADQLEEEMMCDVWARQFLTAKINDYAQVTGQSYKALLNKRSMAMALGTSVLHDITPEYSRWGTHEYPSIGDRAHAMVSGSPLSADSTYWTFSACLLTGIFRRARRQLSMIASDHKALVDDLIQQLR